MLVISNKIIKKTNKGYQVTGTNFLPCISQQNYFKKIGPSVLSLAMRTDELTYTQTHTETHMHRPVGRCKVAYDHPAALIVLRSAYGLPAYTSLCSVIIN